MEQLGTWCHLLFLVPGHQKRLHGDPQPGDHERGEQGLLVRPLLRKHLLVQGWRGQLICLLDNFVLSHNAKLNFLKCWNIHIYQCEHQVLYVQSLEYWKRAIFHLWQFMSCPSTNMLLFWTLCVTKRAVLCWKEDTILTFPEQHYPDTWCPQLTILQRHTCIMLKKCAIFKCPLIWWSQTYENSCKMETLDWAETLGETQSEVKGRERSKDRKTFRSWKRAASITKVNLIWSKTVKGN